MQEEQEQVSLRSMPERRKNRQTNQNRINLDDQNSQSFNFLTQPQFLKLRNLSNIPQYIQSNSQSQIEFLLRRLKELESKVEVLEKKIRYKKKKRIRRTSEQITKKYQCEGCNKKYGTLVSLNLHSRLKHQGQKGQQSKQNSVPEKSVQVSK